MHLAGPPRRLQQPLRWSTRPPSRVDNQPAGGGGGEEGGWVEEQAANRCLRVLLALLPEQYGDDN